MTEFSSDCYDERPWRTVNCSKHRYQQERKKAVTTLDVEGLVVLNQVNDLLTDAMDYIHYKLLKKSG